jgi:hypothetical protein
MIRRYQDKVKTTVLIWGAVKDSYPVPWRDGEDEVLGEIFLMPTGISEDVLSVLIFHHENISEERKLGVQESKKK